MSHPLPPLRERSIGVVLGGFAHEGQMNGPGEPRNLWAGAENMGLAEPSGLAADTWERFDEAVEAVHRVGADHVVTTLEWARIAPSRQGFDDHALARYAGQLDALRGAGVHPIVRLGSALVPAWAGEEFWLMPGSPETFVATMVEAVAALGPMAASWISVSNAIPAAIAGWLSGEAPPFRRFAFSDARLVLDNFLTAHVLLSGELQKLGVSALGLELPQLPFECAEAVSVGLNAARSGTSVEAAIAAARPQQKSGSDLLVALNPFGVSGPIPKSVNPLAAKLLRRPGANRWAQEAERLGANVAQTDVAVNLAKGLSQRVGFPRSFSLTKPQPTTTLPSPLPHETSSSRWFVDEFVATSRNGVVTSKTQPGGMAAYLGERAQQLCEVDGPLRYTYNALLDGYVEGSFAARTGLFGVDRARGRRGLTWLATNAAGADAAQAFRQLAEAVRRSTPS